MGEQLRGRKTVYHRKPSPNFLGVGAALDEEALREHIRKTLQAAKGCSLEFTQRDVYTVNRSIEKVRRLIWRASAVGSRCSLTVNPEVVKL